MCFPLCNIGTVSFQNVLNSQQTLYQVNTSVTDSQYMAIAFQIQNSVPSYFNLILSPTVLTNGSFIGSSASTSFSIPNAYRISFLGGTNFQYPGNFTLASFGNYVSVIEDCNDQAFAQSSSFTNALVNVNSSNTLLKGNTPQVLYLNFSDNQNGQTVLEIQLQQGANDVNLFSPNQTPVTSQTNQLVLNEPIQNLESYYIYIAVSSSTNTVLLYDYAFSQSSVCPSYYPTAGGISPFALTLLGQETATTSASSVYNELLSNNNNSTNAVNYISNRFQGSVTRSTAGGVDTWDGLGINLIVSNNTSTNIQYTNCPPYTGNLNNNAGNLLRLILGGNPYNVGGSGYSNVIALTNGNDGLVTAPSTTSSIFPESADTFYFDAVIFEDLSNTTTGNFMALVKIATSVNPQYDPSSPSYNSIVANNAPLMTSYGLTIPKGSGSSLNASFINGSVRAGLYNINSAPTQIVNSQSYGCGILNREFDGISAISDTVYVQQLLTPSQQTVARFVTVQFDYTLDSSSTTQGTFGFVLQASPIVQSTTNPNNSAAWKSGGYGTQPNSCFLPALKWICNFDTSAVASSSKTNINFYNDWVGLSDGNDGNLNVQASNNYATTLASQFVNNATSVVTITVIIDLQGMASWTYFGPIVNGDSSEAVPYMNSLVTSPVENPNSTIQQLTPLNINTNGLFLFQWDPEQLGSFSNVQCTFDNTSSTNLIDPAYNPFKAFVPCPNMNNTNVCIPNINPSTLAPIIGNINVDGVIGISSPFGSAQQTSVQTKTPFRTVVQQIGNSFQNTEFYGNNPSLCPNNADLCVPQYSTNNFNFALNLTPVYSPIPLPFANNGSGWEPDTCASTCLNSPDPSTATLPSSCGETSCVEYLTNKYGNYIPNLQSILNQTYKTPYPLTSPVADVGICAFGVCPSLSEYSSLCPDYTSSTPPSSDQIPFAQSTQLNPYLTSAPCATNLTAVASNPEMHTSQKFKCGDGSTDNWDTVYQTLYYCDASSNANSLTPINQFGNIVVPPPAGLGTSPTITAYEICGPNCNSFDSSSMSLGWTGSCGWVTLDPTNLNSNILYTENSPGYTDFNTSYTGCAATLTYNNEQYLTPTDPIIGPVLCQYPNQSSSTNGPSNLLGLDMQVTTPANTFANPNVGTLSLVSTFMGSNPTSFYYYQDKSSNSVNLPTCPTPVSPTGPECPNIFGSFDAWNYGQMFINYNPFSSQPQSFSQLPYTSTMFSQQLPSTCDVTTFPSLFT